MTCRKSSPLAQVKPQAAAGWFPTDGLALLQLAEYFLQVKS